MTAAPPPSPRGGKRRFSIIGLIGELLITAGVLVFLFLGWQLWLNDLIVGAQQDKAAVQLAKEWSGSVPTRTRPTTVAPPD
jgi:sortase A